MPSRSKILRRIHLALRIPTHPPPSPRKSTLFPPIPSSEFLTRFEAELRTLHGEFHCALDWQDAHHWVQEIIHKHQFQCVVTTPHPDTIQAGRMVHACLPLTHRDCGKNLADIDLGITECDCLVARTGSVVLTTQTGFGRALSILPSSHLVVARFSQLVADLSDAYSILRAKHGNGSWPSMITIITGPSRTSDIEKTLVLGAHGPKNFFVLLLRF